MKKIGRFGPLPSARVRRMALSLSLALALLAPALAQVDVLTQHNDNARTGANLEETILTTSNVNVSQFGKIFQRSVDDQIYAQPLVVSNVSIGGGTHNVVYIATVNNSVYAFDADDASVTTPYWHVNFGAPVSGHFGCHDFSGNYSIVGTPVIDKSTNTMYVVDQVATAGNAHHLHALDIGTGHDKSGSPITIGISNQLQNQRPALLLANGNVYVGFGSHCDSGTYHGILIAYDANSLAEVARFNSTPSANQGALWQSGQGPAADGVGNIYVVTGNGSFDGTSNFSQSIVKLGPTLNRLDWFAPTNNGSLSSADKDLNSSGPHLIPGTSLVITGSKEGVLYVAETSSLGHLGGFLQRFSVSSSEVHTGVVYWNSASVGPLIYVWGDGSTLKAFKVNPGGVTTTPQATGPETISGGRTVATLSVSASGNTNGIVWADGRGTLHAYDGNNVSHELYNSAQNSSRDSCGSFSKNAAPTIANGKVYLASFSGMFCVYGLMGTPPPTPTPTITPTPTVTPTVTATPTPTPTPPGCVSVAAKQPFTHTPFTAQTGTFTATFDATATDNNPTVNDVIALSNGPQTNIGNFPVITSFSDTGHFVARNAGVYSATNVLNYMVGTSYHFRIVVNVPGHTYSVFVTPPNAAEVTVASNFTFRTGATATSLNNVGSEVTAATGSLSYCNFAVH